MNYKKNLFKVIGATIFLLGGLIGGFSQTDGTWLSKKPFLFLFLSLFIMGIGVTVWKSSKSLGDSDKIE